ASVGIGKAALAGPPTPQMLILHQAHTETDVSFDLASISAPVLAVAHSLLSHACLDLFVCKCFLKLLPSSRYERCYLPSTIYSEHDVIAGACTAFGKDSTVRSGHCDRLARVVCNNK